MEKKHILHVNIDNNGGNGAFTLIRYLYEYLFDSYIFDYYTMGKFVEDNVLYSILIDGGFCYSENLNNNKLLKHILLPFKFYSFLKKHSYEIIHIHSEVAYKHFLYSFVAKRMNTKTIIIHSHSSDIDGEYKKIKLLFHMLFKRKVNKYGTNFLACSKIAAKWMFMPKILNGESFYILNNGITPEKYHFSETVRLKVRKNLGLSENIVIGHVGALKKVKNQEFLIDILSHLKENNYKLLLVGDGDCKEKLMKKAKKLKCDEQVLFLGNRTDVSDLLQAMDIFVFPSFFEGTPMALIEAQAVGLPIIASDIINSDIKINNNLFFYSLNESAKLWSEEVKKKKDNHIKSEGFNNIYHSMYNIQNSAKKLRVIYQ